MDEMNMSLPSSGDPILDKLNAAREACSGDVGRIRYWLDRLSLKLADKNWKDHWPDPATLPAIARDVRAIDHFFERLIDALDSKREPGNQIVDGPGSLN